MGRRMCVRLCHRPIFTKCTRGTWELQSHGGINELQGQRPGPPSEEQTQLVKRSRWPHPRICMGHGRAPLLLPPLSLLVGASNPWVLQWNGQRQETSLVSLILDSFSFCFSRRKTNSCLYLQPMISVLFSLTAIDFFPINVLRKERP